MNNTPPEVMRKWQEEFCEWFHEAYLIRVQFDDDTVRPLETPTKSRVGRSVPLIANVAWQSWKMARKSVRIDLPEKETELMDQHSTGVNLGISECRMAIRQQGYTVN